MEALSKEMCLWDNRRAWGSPEKAVGLWKEEVQAPAQRWQSESQEPEGLLGHSDFFVLLTLLILIGIREVRGFTRAAGVRWGGGQGPFQQVSRVRGRMVGQAWTPDVFFLIPRALLAYVTKVWVRV